MINELAKQAYKNAKDKGFYDNKRSIAEALCLIHSEVSEALEADRAGLYANWDNFNKKICILNDVANLKAADSQEDLYKDNWKIAFDLHIKNTFEDELADIIIRVMDLAASMGIDLEAHIQAKMNRNLLRERKHGKKY